MKRSSKKYISKNDALIKMRYYCAYQERCHQEVISKLFDLGIYENDADEIMVNLITDNFLNEERFAKTFAGGKFRIKKWGRIKIIRELKRRDISEYCLKKAMGEIEMEEYKKTLKEILEKKSARLSEKNSFTRNKKLARYAIQKGYESNLIWETIRQMHSTDTIFR